MEGYPLHTIFRLVMERMSFSEFMGAVKAAPITPMQALELMSIVYRYMQARHKYFESSTPESVALARWDMNDIEQEYDSMRFKLSCRLPRLTQFRTAIF